MKDSPALSGRMMTARSRGALDVTLTWDVTGKSVIQVTIVTVGTFGALKSSEMWRIKY